MVSFLLRFVSWLSEDETKRPLPTSGETIFRVKGPETDKEPARLAGPGRAR